MVCNVGSTDRTIRIVVGLALIVGAFLHLIGLWGWIGIVPLATGLFRFCPAYKVLGMNTAEKESGAS